MSVMTAVTEAKAQAALAAVRQQFASYLEPMTFPEETLPDGTVVPAATYPPSCPAPTLDMAWQADDGPPYVAILWESGPDDWAHRATIGGTSEEERVLAAQAAQEFGVDPQAMMPKPDEPVRWPAGVEAEPYYSFVLVLYPA